MSDEAGNKPFLRDGFFVQLFFYIFEDVHDVILLFKGYLSSSSFIFHLSKFVWDFFDKVPESS